MNSLAIALVLFGCSDDLSQCFKLGSEAYATKSECESRHLHVLSSREALSADYPTVTAMCMDARKALSLGQAPHDFSGDWQ